VNSNFYGMHILPKYPLNSRFLDLSLNIVTECFLPHAISSDVKVPLTVPLHILNFLHM